MDVVLRGCGVLLSGMAFDVSPDAYARFMGRYSQLLSAPFADEAGVRDGMRVLDVGCGPGALTAELVRRVPPGSVAAADPSPPFVEAVRARFPGVPVRRASAERLPWPGACFDAALAQLVVHFMADPVAGLTQMARVTRPGGVVAASTWDEPGGRSPLTPFWRVAGDLLGRGVVRDHPAGTGEGELAALLEEAGLAQVRAGGLTVRQVFATFEEWWEPYLAGVGPAGDVVASLDPGQVGALRARCEESLPPPVVVEATAWFAVGRVR